MGNPTTFAEFMQRMGEAFPDATVDEDNDGQLVIYTNLRESGDNVVSFE